MLKLITAAGKPIEYRSIWYRSIEYRSIVYSSTECNSIGYRSIYVAAGVLLQIEGGKLLVSIWKTVGVMT